MSKYFSREGRLARRAIRSEAASKVGEALNADRKLTAYKLTTQNAGKHALEMVKDIFANYTLPSRPQLGYSQIRSAKHASNNKVESGVITINATFKTHTGVTVGVDVPVEIRDGQLLEPSVVVYNGAPRVIAQSTFDSLIDRNSTYEDEPLRKLYAPPMTKQHNQNALDNRRRTVRVNNGLFSTASAQEDLRSVVAGRAVQRRAQDGTGVVKSPMDLNRTTDIDLPKGPPKITPQPALGEGLAAPGKSPGTMQYGEPSDPDAMYDLAQQWRHERTAPPSIPPVTQEEMSARSLNKIDWGAQVPGKAAQKDFLKNKRGECAECRGTGWVRDGDEERHCPYCKVRRPPKDDADTTNGPKKAQKTPESMRPCLACGKEIFTPFGGGSSAPSWQGHFCSEGCKAKYIDSGDVKKKADMVLDPHVIQDVDSALYSALSAGGTIGSFDDMSGLAQPLLDTANALSVALSADSTAQSLYNALSQAESENDLQRYAELTSRLLALSLDHVMPELAYGEPGGAVSTDVMAAIMPLARALGVNVSSSSTMQMPAEMPNRQVSAGRVAKSPPGKEKMVERLKEEGHSDDSAFAIAWSQHNKEHGKKAQYAEHDYKKFDPARNSDESHLDPAERERDHKQSGTLSETVEVKNRGGGICEYSKGSKVKILRDLAGDGTAFVVEFDDGCQAILESHLLK